MRDYFVSTFYFSVPYRLVWAEWFNEFDEPYYDVWCDGV